MRIFTLSLFVLSLFAGVTYIGPQMAHAGECVYDDLAGAWHDSVTFTECTPTGGTTGSAGSPGSSGGLTSPGSAGSPGNSAGSGQNIRLINPLNTGECAPNQNCLLNFLNKILDFVIRIGTVVVILMLVYVGYLFVVAQGKEEKIREARQALLWTVVGALVLLGSQAIALGIEATVKAISAGG